MLNTPATIDGNISAVSIAALSGITAEKEGRQASRSQMLPAMEQTLQSMFGVNAGPSSQVFADRLAALGSAAQEPVGQKVTGLQAEPVSTRPDAKPRSVPLPGKKL